MPGNSQLPAVLDLAADVAARYEISALSGLLASARASAEQDEISVAVLGRFKAGKSSFLNHLHRTQHPSGRCRAGYSRGHGNPLRRPRRGTRSSPGWPRSGGSARPDRRLHLREGKPGERQASRSDYRGTAGIATISRPEVRRYAGSRERAFSQHANIVGLAAECGTRVGGGQRRPAPFAARHRPAEEPLPVHAEGRPYCLPKPTF